MTTLVKIRDKDNPKNWKAFNLLSYIDKRDDFFYFELNSFIINSLKEQTFFTPLDLIITNSLSSQYSIIFYELAIRYKKYKIPKMTIQEVRELTETTNEYSRIEAFRRRVLDPACAEITEKTDIILSYETIKTGKNISHIDFTITHKKDNYFNENIFPNTKENKSISKLFLVCRVQTDEVENFISKSIDKYSFEIFESNIKYTNKNAKNNYLAYLKRALGHDWAKSTREEKKKKGAQKRIPLDNEPSNIDFNNLTEAEKKGLEMVNKRVLKK
jgi:plasmid replication initiation protein